MAAPTELFRLAQVADVPEDAWKTRLQWTTCYMGVAGLDDKFMHLSTAEQIAGTAAACCRRCHAAALLGGIYGGGG